MLPSATRPESAPSRRALWMVLPAVYVVTAVARDGQARPLAWAFSAAGIGVALWAALGRAPVPEAERDRRLSLVLLSVALATAGLSSRPPWAATLRELSALGAAIVALRVLARAETDAGLAGAAADAIAPRGLGPQNLAKGALGAVVACWSLCLGADLFSWTGAVQGSERTLVLLATSCGASSIFVLGGGALVLAFSRRLELAAPPRLFVAAGAAALGLVSALSLAAGGATSADAAAALGTTASAAMIVRTARVRDPARLAATGRRALTLIVFVGPIVALVPVVGILPGASVAATCLVVLAAAAAALTPKLEETFLPEKGVWLLALDEATAKTRDRDTRDAISHALSKLREAAGPDAPSPELWMLHPTRVLTIDAAGYVRERAAELPVDLLSLAREEPHTTVRLAVLSALEVRRADLRPLLRFLKDRGALFATLIADAGEPEGVLLVPAGRRIDPLTLEEVRAAKKLADAFVSTCQAESARVRHLERVRTLEGCIERLEDELEAASHRASLDAGRNVLASTRLARPATVGIYSAAARMAYEALERRVARNAPLVVVARPGIDPVPYVARAHLSGPRREGPLVVVDGTVSREHDLARWKDERTSPLALADRGLLLLASAAALPREVQVLVARCVSERRTPWERAAPLDVVLALTDVASPEELAHSGRLAPELFSRVEDTPAVVLPRLRERADDLRSIVADRLAREGLRVRGRPLGIDNGAFALLVEHPFEGEDDELTAIVGRLVARASDDVVRAVDVRAIGLAPELDRAEHGTSAAHAARGK